MTDIAGAAATAEVLAGDPHRRVDPAHAHLEDAEAHGRCANCETPLHGAYCFNCGQKAHLHARLRDLLHEAVEGIAHFDGRLWRTLPMLAFRPGRLSREWREGRRVRYVQPLHLFLFATFLLFVIPNFTGRHIINLNDGDGGVVRVQNSETATPEQRAVARALEGDEVTPEDVAKMSRPERWSMTMGEKLEHVFENSEYYSYKIESLAYKLSFIIVPISMLILALLLVFKRGFTFYDHGVVALYGVGFLTLLLAIVSLFPERWASVLGPMATLAAGVHAVVHLHGAYGLSWFGAVLRGIALGILSTVGFVLFIGGVFLLGILG
jgi:hypothetical protein